MKLFYSPTSPFARKVRIVAHESGRAEEIELIANNPFKDEQVRGFNPLGKIPTLVLDGGSALYDSVVIAEYLDERFGAGLFPKSGAERWRALRLQALGDGLSEAVIQQYRNTQRKPEEPLTMYAARADLAADAALLTLNQERLISEVSIGEIAVAAAIGYLDLRFTESQWRQVYPSLSRWFEHFSTRESFRLTRPDAPVAQS